MKKYNQMTPSEQQEFAQKLSDYQSNIIPKLNDNFDVETFKVGLELLSAWPSMTSFVQQAHIFHDYRERYSAFVGAVNRICNQIAKSLRRTEARSMTATEAQNIVAAPRHRGRPTLEEAKEHKEATEIVKEQEEKQHPKMFDSSDVVSPAATKPHLDQLKWLLSADLQVAVENIRTWRTELSTASAMAKLLAEQGKPESEVGVYAERAIELNDTIENSYQAIDRELAECCVRLKYDPRYTAQMTEQLEPRYGKSATPAKVEELRLMLKDYLDSVTKEDADFKQRVIDKIHSEDPELKAQREAEKAKHDRIAEIRKYLLRTDKQNTKRRVATMEKRIEELKEIGDENWEAYLPVLAKAKKEAGVE